MSTPKVTALVLNWNGLEDTLACVDSLARLDYGNLRVIVIDNGSKFSPAKEVSSRHAWVRIIENERNLGYAGGNNVGMRAALDEGAEFIWVLNNDVVVEPDSLDHLVAAAQRHERAGAVGGKVFRGDEPARLWMTWGRVTWLQSLIALEGRNRLDDGRYDVERAVDWLPGCSILFRANALKEVGLFDEDYFAYHEDVEWAARARGYGWQCWFSGASRIHHSAHGSSGGEQTYVGFRKYLSARNSILYARSYARFHQKLLMYAAIVITLPFQFLRRLASGEQEGIYLKIRGWIDGLRGRPVPQTQLGLD